MTKYEYKFKKRRKSLLAKLLITMVSLLITAYILPGMVVKGVLAGFIASLILGIVNIFIKPIFIVLTLPLTIMTMGLFLIVINGLMLMLASIIVPGFIIYSFWTSIIAAILLSIVTWFLNQILD